MSLRKVNRVYSLVVGNEDNAIEITNLQVKFSVVKTSNNKEKKNKASVEIYNLNQEHQKLLEEKYITVRLKVGYAPDFHSEPELTTLFVGQVVDNTTRKAFTSRTKSSGTDKISTLTVDEFFTELNAGQVNKFVPEGSTVKDVILTAVQELPEVTRHEIGGKLVNTPLPDGFPASGTPRQVLDRVSEYYGVEWQIDQGVLYVSDPEGSYSDNTASVPVISEASGMIDSPEFKSANVKRVNSKRGKNKQSVEDALHLKILMDAKITAGSIVKLQWGDIDNYFKVNEVEHKGDFSSNEWYSNLILSPDPLGG